MNSRNLRVLQSTHQLDSFHSNSWVLQAMHQSVLYSFHSNPIGKKKLIVSFKFFLTLPHL